jgi:CheY-like chemotaxis protein
MTCPFCDDGDVYFNGPSPVAQMPVPSARSIPSAQSLGRELQLAQIRAAASTPASTPSPAPAPIEEPAPPANAKSEISWNTLGVEVSLFFFGIIMFRRFCPTLAEYLNQKLNPLAAAKAAPPPAGDPTLSEFYLALRASMKGGLDYSESETPLAMREASDRQHRFFAAVPGQLASLTAIFAGISQTPDADGRLRILRQILEQIGPVKNAARFPAVLPVWQLAAALEALLKQVTSKTSAITPSALQTVAGALDLLQTLCVPGLKPDLTTSPPVRLLAVDDDPISQHAVSSALKKVFDTPDVAAHGKGALDLASVQTYDVIFLDVEMPGMDGFELCSKIQETAANRGTPVVFVTSHGDFDSRAKSTLIGAHELVAKPFVSSELGLKALTLVIRSRLKGGAERTAAVRRRVAVPAAQPAPPSENSPSAAVPPVPPDLVPPPAHERRPDVLKPGEDNSPAIAEPLPHEFAKACSIHAPGHLAELRARLEAAISAHANTVQDILGELYITVHGLCGEAERAELRAVHRLGYTLESMLKKLFEKPSLCTPSSFDAAVAAIELLEDLCSKGIDPSLSHPPLQMLVVDDDPVARRVTSGALQIAFGKPDCAESGEAAVALAQEKEFDVIFMDIRMPGLDGFQACAQIREAVRNAAAPIIFLTSHGDMQSRAEASKAGGTGFIVKPVTPSEIRLTALTFVLRRRLNKINNALTGRDVGVTTTETKETLSC